MTRKQSSSIKYQAQQSLHSIQPTLAPLTVAVSSVLAAGTLQAATITVDTLDDGMISGQCSLRSALYAATSNLPHNGCVSGETGADTILFESTLSGTIQLVDDFNYGFDGSTLPIGESVIIDGDDRITVRGTGSGQVFHVKYDSDPSFNAESVSISNLTISNGFSFDYGAGIYALSDELYLSNVTLSGHTAQVGGAAVFHRPYLIFTIGALEIVDSTIEFNSSYLATTGGSGGAVWAETPYYASSIEVDNSSFSNNSSGGQGGAIYVRTGRRSSLTITNSEFFGNSADEAEGAGGALFAYLLESDVDISDNIFVSNWTSGDGGGVFVDENFGERDWDNIRLADNAFTDNQANGSGGGAFITAGNGVFPYTSIELTGNNRFVGNSAELVGGGLAIVADDTVSSVISGAQFRLNDGPSYGGGLASLVGGDFLATDNVFVNNSAFNGGGASIISYGGAVGVERSNFMDNTAFGTAGGGLYVWGDSGQAEIAQSIFSGNAAYVRGGGLSIYASAQSMPVEIRSSEFSENGTTGSIFNSGGAVYMFASENSQLYVRNSTLSGNSSYNGGGLGLFGAMGAEIQYSTIADNVAFDDGGGVYSELENGCIVRNSILAGNTVGPEGDPQELSAGQYPCEVDHSLLAAAKYSDYNNGAGNILNQDALLVPLADNGGMGGRTHALQAGSPAIDAGDIGTAVPETDQRGGAFQRVAGNGLDMGAYELQALVDGIFADRFESP